MNKRHRTKSWNETEMDAVFNEATRLLQDGIHRGRRTLFGEAQKILPEERRYSMYGTQATKLWFRFKAWKKEIKQAPRIVRDRPLPTLTPLRAIATTLNGAAVNFCPNCAFDLRRIQFSPI